MIVYIINMDENFVAILLYYYYKNIIKSCVKKEFVLCNIKNIQLSFVIMNKTFITALTKVCCYDTV